MTFVRGLLMSGLVLLAAACAPTLQSDVARFHQLSAPQGETFVIVPMDPDKAGGLEFAAYAKLVSDRLSQLGYRPAVEPAAAQLTVKMDYQVSPGRERVATRNYGGYGGFGGSGWYSPWGYRGWSRSGWYSPWGYGDSFGGGWDYPEVYSYTVFDRALSLTIARTADGQKLFEGTVESQGQDNRLPELMPYLVQSMFTDFPGRSGVTQHVKLKLPTN